MLATVARHQQEAKSPPTVSYDEDSGCFLGGDAVKFSPGLKDTLSKASAKLRK